MAARASYAGAQHQGALSKQLKSILVVFCPHKSSHGDGPTPSSPASAVPGARRQILRHPTSKTICLLQEDNETDAIRNCQRR